MNLETGHVVTREYLESQALRRKVLEGSSAQGRRLAEQLRSLEQSRAVQEDREPRTLHELVEAGEVEKLYEPLPKRLETEARKVLKGKPQAHVATHNGGQLAKYAIARRKGAAALRGNARAGRDGR